MAIDFKKFQQEFPAEDMTKKVTEAKENGGGGYEKIPDGEYRCKVEKMELRESKKGAPMCSIQFRITAGDYKKQCLFYNRVLAGTKNDGFMIHGCNEFLESLDSGETVEFKNWEQYNDLICDIFEIITGDKLEYMIQIKNDCDFANLTVGDIIDELLITPAGNDSRGLYIG